MPLLAELGLVPGDGLTIYMALLTELFAPAAALANPSIALR
jgi:hypothetical protein